MTHENEFLNEITCQACKVRLRYKGRSNPVKIKCPKCGSFVIAPPNPTPSAIDKKETFSDSGSDFWQIQSLDGNTYGPFSVQQLIEFVPQLRIAPESKVKNVAKKENPWISACEIPELETAFNQMPPSSIPPRIVDKKAVGIDRKADLNEERLDTHSSNDTWGVAGSIAGGISGGMLVVSLCFTPFACIAVPLSAGGIISACFSTNPRLKRIGLIGNLLVLILSLAITYLVVRSMRREFW